MNVIAGGENQITRNMGKTADQSSVPTKRVFNALADVKNTIHMIKEHTKAEKNSLFKTPKSIRKPLNFALKKDTPRPIFATPSAKPFAIFEDDLDNDNDNDHDHEKCQSDYLHDTVYKHNDLQIERNTLKKLVKWQTWLSNDKLDMSPVPPKPAEDLKVNFIQEEIYKIDLCVEEVNLDIDPLEFE